MVCLSVFGTIAYFVVFVDMLAFDTVIRNAVYELRSEKLTFILKVITYTANWQFITIICMVLLIIPKTFIPFGLPLSVTAIIASICNYAVKIIIHRARPDITLHLIEQGGYSFPSGHSTTAMLFYGMMIYLLHRRIRQDQSDAGIPAKKSILVINALSILLICLILIIGFSRIYLGVHYPSDVIAGWSFGLFLLILISSAYSLADKFR